MSLNVISFQVEIWRMLDVLDECWSVASRAVQSKYAVRSRIPLTIPLQRVNMICHCTYFQIHRRYWQCVDTHWPPNADPPLAVLSDCRAALSVRIFGLSLGLCTAPLYRWCQGQVLYLKFHMRLWSVSSSVGVVHLLIQSIALWCRGVYDVCVWVC